MEVNVGIMSAPVVKVTFHGQYSRNGETFAWNEMVFEPGDAETYPLVFMPVSLHDSCFELEDVTIGREFHWERKERQSFRGTLKIMPHGEELVAINILPVEEYLKSVVASEMKPTAPLEFIKAHAIISRSWLMAQILFNKQGNEHDCVIDTPDTRIRWYDHSQHELFDVCADDHCQRYQGISRIMNKNAVKGVEETSGMILSYDGKICDARFSKCCGGAMEKFGFCWEDKDFPYLSAGRDFCNEAILPDLTDEEEAEKWIEGNPASFCNVTDPAFLSEVMNGYDTKTTDFYRWKEEYSSEELREIVREKTGVDFGEILDIVPLERGVSGRLSRIRITGSLHSMTIGKELEIRRCLSISHLKSSAFVVRKQLHKDCKHLVSFSFLGAGWGHGVGLCQIGAAEMARRGYDYKEILSHYYPGATIEIRKKWGQYDYRTGTEIMDVNSSNGHLR